MKKICFLTSITVLAQPVFAQGPLTPPAAPAPTYKTLTEVEPRTIISELPFTISASGSYYLGASLTGTSGQSGITISASNVTLDLNGFSLTGVAGSLEGITVSGTPSNVRILNGTINAWEQNGINIENGSRFELSKLFISSNGQDGVRLGAQSSVTDCHIHQNLDGIEMTGVSSIIKNNFLENNRRDGILIANEQAVVEENECIDNSRNGFIVTGNNNTVRNNKTISNGTGFNAAGTGNAILLNYTKDNGPDAESNQVFSSITNQYDILISDIPELINVPCNAKLTGNVINTINNDDGIVIDSDNVTLDLGGFSIIGSGAVIQQYQSTGSSGDLASANTPGIGNFIATGVNSDDGIVVQGSQENITIRNGSVVAWGGDGINALNADFSLFEKLHISFNENDGLVADFNCIIKDCTANANGLDGLEGDDGTVIAHCSAGQNGDNGIQTSDGCQVSNCASFNNDSDGFDVTSGSTITDCSASDNRVFGFDIALGGTCLNSTAYDNNGGGLSNTSNPFPSQPGSPVSIINGNGFDMASSCILRNCHASLNEGHGVRMFANSWIIDCKFHENDFDGIRVSSTDCVIEGNVVTDNDDVGIHNTSSGSLIIRNKAAGNVTNYIINAASAFGPIIDVTGDGDISATAGTEHPQTNFSF